jgi:hypothetical protein
VFDLAEPRVRGRDSALAESGFAPLAWLRQRCGEFESWSEFLQEGGWLAP